MCCSRSPTRFTPGPAPHLVSRPRRRAVGVGLRAGPRARAVARWRGDRAHAHVDRRKTSGSFYTPQALTGFLVRTTLAPLVDGRPADEILRLRIVDPSMGSGAFLVAACVFLADCCEQALIRDGQWPAAEVSAADRASLRRQIAERCLYGVDLNPTAVQLARLSLWLTTLAANRPLTFLDHHLAAGNSLIGACLSDLSRPPVVAQWPGAFSAAALRRSACR